MNDIIDFLTSTSTIAYITAFVIFIITVILLVRRLIGFMISLLLLLFALASGLAIANHDLFREMLVSFKYDPHKNSSQKTNYYKNQLQKAYEELKQDFLNQKKKLDTLYDSYQKTPPNSKRPSSVEEENNSSKREKI